MRNTVVITDAAAADIVDQFNYIRSVKLEPMNADRWLRGVYNAVAELEIIAGYARAPESDLLGVELRQKVFKSHRIIFSYYPNKHEVTIHYVRHAARKPMGESAEEE